MTYVDVSLNNTDKYLKILKGETFKIGTSSLVAVNSGTNLSGRILTGSYTE